MLHPYRTMLLAETDAAHSTTPCAGPGVCPEIFLVTVTLKDEGTSQGAHP